MWTIKEKQCPVMKYMFNANANLDRRPMIDLPEWANEKTARARLNRRSRAARLRPEKELQG